MTYLHSIAGIRTVIATAAVLAWIACSKVPLFAAEGVKSAVDRELGLAATENCWQRVKAKDEREKSD
jgi:hypothetical protein